MYLESLDSLTFITVLLFFIVSFIAVKKTKRVNE